MMDIEKRALDLRKKFIKTAVLVDASHVASSLSCLDIITALYFGGVLKYDSSNPQMPDRDRFVLSKGHSALALYNVLCEAGFFTRAELHTYCKPGSEFGGHVTYNVPGVECSTGALGHGLSFAVGLALSARIKKENWLTYVITGDGECQEGSIWEAAMSIVQFNLTNLIWIIDRNSLQSDDSTENVMKLEPLEKKLEAFGFDTAFVDGHDCKKLISVVESARTRLHQNPLVVIAKTIKGKGAPLLENKNNSHSKKPSTDEYKTIFEFLGITLENEE
jgi:transketolase